ncbi:uncharacterized protein LOC143178828 [Calliopsis andreniformis]|uniref:uncharacterized protein LOC143178828 n=1 Tax=Calliopsis andreniformis TaxID=337506 RepID=UPI003FCDDF2B
MPGGDQDQRPVGDVVTPGHTSFILRIVRTFILHHVTSIQFLPIGKLFLSIDRLRLSNYLTSCFAPLNENTTDNRILSMLSINMRVFKTVLIIVALFTDRIECLPLANETSIEESSIIKDPQSNLLDDHYDQRQEGTENYRVHLGNVVVVVAPVEALLLTGGAGKPNLSNLKPTTDNPQLEPRPFSESKSTNRSGLNLANLLIPFLRRFHHK